MWEDPDWEEMIRESDIIVLADVIEGGTFRAKVSAKKIYKGMVPVNPFWVRGY